MNAFKKRLILDEILKELCSLMTLTFFWKDPLTYIFLPVFIHLVMWSLHGKETGQNVDEYPEIRILGVPFTLLNIVLYFFPIGQ